MKISKENKILKTGSWIISRIVIIYLLIYGLSLLFINHHDAFDLARLKTLNRLMPDDFSCLVDATDCEQSDFKHIIYYYKKITEYIPHVSESYDILGYCYYHIGEIDRSIDSYKKASKRNPYLFWPYYNLGVIYYEEGRYEEAIHVLKRAVNVNPSATMKYMSESKIYQQLIRATQDSNIIGMEALRSAYKDSYVMLVLSYYRLENYKTMLNITQLALQNRLNDTGEFSYYQGLAAYYLHYYDEAIIFFRESLSRNGKIIDTYKYLALTLKELGIESAADELFQMVIILERSGLGQRLDKEFQLRIF